MSDIREVSSKRKFMGRLSHGSDLLEEITDICAARSISLGRIEGLGAVSKGRLGYYDQDGREYQFLEIDRHLEITSLIGNVSIKDGKPIVHAHITFSDDAGNAFGGHLAPGTVVFACEAVIEEFDGPNFERGFDEETGLPLWNSED